MTETQMVKARESGKLVRDIIAESGCPPWYVYDVMKRNGLSRMDKEPKHYSVTVRIVRYETISVMATGKAEAERMAKLRFPDAEKAEAHRIGGMNE